MKRLKKKALGVLAVSLACVSLVGGVTPTYAQSIKVSKQPYKIENARVVLDSIVSKGRTYTELRAISKYTDLEIDYKDGFVSITRNFGGNSANSKMIEIDTKNNTASLYDMFRLGAEGSIKPINAPVIMSNGKTFLPLRVIAENLGYSISYTNGTVVLSSASDSKSLVTENELELYQNINAKILNGGYCICGTDECMSLDSEDINHVTQIEGLNHLAHELVRIGSGFYTFGSGLFATNEEIFEHITNKRVELENMVSQYSKANGKLSDTLMNYVVNIDKTLELLGEQYKLDDYTFYRNNSKVFEAIKEYNKVAQLAEKIAPNKGYEVCRINDDAVLRTCKTRMK